MSNADQSKKLVLIIFSALFVGVLFSLMLKYVPAFGQHIPSQNLISEYIDGAIWALGLTVLLLVIPFSKEIHRSIILIWICKCAVTLGFMLYYEYAYNLDAYWYYKQGIKPNFIYELKFGHGTYNLVWLVWLANKALPLMESYHALKVLWSFVGLMGLLLFYYGFAAYIKKHSVKMLWLLGLFPSSIFWSSILNKDPIVIFGIGLFAFGAFSSLRVQKFKYVACILMGVFIAGSIRMWLVPILMTPYVFTYIFSSNRRIFVKIISIGLLGATLFSGFTYVQTQMKIGSGVDVVNSMNRLSKSWNTGGARQEVPEFKSFKDLIVFAPKGMFAAVFRPLPGEINNVFGIMVGIENAVLLVVFAYMCLYFNISFFKDRFIVFSFSLLIVWSLMYGFVSYQNLGTAIRFRLQIFPLLILLPYYVLYIRPGLYKRH